MALPPAHGKIAFASRDDVQDRALIEFEEGGGTQFQARLAPGGRRDRGGVRCQRLKKIMQVQLNRPDGFLQEQRDDIHKGQTAAAGELFVTPAMAVAEGGFINQLAGGLNSDLRGRVSKRD